MMKSILRPSRTLERVYLYRDPVDFRKAAFGLAAIIEQALQHDPFSGTLYAFTNRQRNKIKCVFWDHNGVVLYYKSLAEETFKWPKRGDEVLALTGEQMNWLLEGYDISQMTPHKRLEYSRL